MELPQELLLPQKTISSPDCTKLLPSETKEYNSRGLIIYGSSFDKYSGKKDLIKQLPDVKFIKRSGPEPTIDEISDYLSMAREIKSEFICGIGGGSILDLSKAVAGLYNAKKKPEYYQQGGKLEKAGIPFIAIPTTGGTGSETTINSVIINTKKNIKLSIRDKSFLASKVFLDPVLLKSLPRSILSYAGMDALVQAYESFVSIKATGFTEELALRAIKLVNDNILQAYNDPDQNNLNSLLIGSYYCGIALAHSRLGVIHGIAHPLGVLYNLPHGQVCAVCLPASIKLNKKYMEEKYKIISSTINADFLDRSVELIEKLKIPSPFKGQSVKEEAKIIEETVKSGSTAANPKKITPEDVKSLLKELF